MLPKDNFKILGGEETRRLEEEFGQILARLKVGKDERRVLEAFLSPLKHKNAFTHFHYQHSLRVAILLEVIAGAVGFEKKALVYAGVLHDVGKALIPVENLNVGKHWTERDAAIMREHVLFGYRLLKGRFDFTAEVILLHHRFQKNRYPRKMPPESRNYSQETRRIIKNHARILALADCYDASHRERNSDGEMEVLSGAEIRTQMYSLNPDLVGLIEWLYEKKIFVI